VTTRQKCPDAPQATVSALTGVSCQSHAATTDM